IEYSPFRMELVRRNKEDKDSSNGEVILKVNELQWLHMETARNRTAEDPEEWWQEQHSSHTFHHDRGPEGVGCDFTFMGSQTLYGIPEHAASLALRDTFEYNTVTTEGGGGGGEGGRGQANEPYRLYNLDVFEYELDIPDSFTVPFLC
ncbi:alpha glucosidase II, alpha subunit, partial [Reticulomyxa filosa]